MGGIDAALHFFVSVGLEAGYIIVRASGTVHFDDVCARRDLLSHHSQTSGTPSAAPPEGGVQVAL